MRSHLLEHIKLYFMYYKKTKDTDFTNLHGFCTDGDLIVVKETEKRFLDRLDEFYYDASEPLDVLVYTPEEFESMKNRPFLRRAMEGGKVLYDARS